MIKIMDLGFFKVFYGHIVIWLQIIINIIMNEPYAAARW